MLSEDQYLERTVDMVAKIRAMREAAEKEMNRFTRAADYEMRRGFGQKPKATPVSDETAPPGPAGARLKRSVAKSAATQTWMEFSPAPAESGENEEEA